MGELVKWLAIHLQGTEHGRHLLNGTAKSNHGSLKIGSRKIGDWRLSNNLTVGVATVSGDTQFDSRPILLVGIQQELREFCRLTKAQRQQTRRQRIKAAGVASLVGIKQAFGRLQRAVGSNPLGLIKNQYTINLAASIPAVNSGRWLRHCCSRYRDQRHPDPGASWHPWPEPPGSPDPFSRRFRW